MKVFDNLYFVGQTEYSAWVVTTTEGMILIDTLFDYSVEEEVVGGLKKLALDPAMIRYVIVTHPHPDHHGGAKFLQDHYKPRVVMSGADWDVIDRLSGTKPARDMVATDGQTLTLGDTTVTMYVTPGHTLGTMSTLIPVKDGQTSHLAAYWGGTAFNWIRGPAAYITPERPPKFWFETYAQSARRFRDLITRQGVDVILSNHTKYDRTPQKLAALKTRTPGGAHPYVVGTPSVQRFLTVAEECALTGAS